MTSELISVLAQVPLVGAFIWFVLELTKRQQAEQTERDHQWRTFLTEQGSSNNEALGRMAIELRATATELARINENVVQHDTRMITALGQFRRFDRADTEDAQA